MPRVIETVAQGRLIVLPEDVPATARCMVTILEDDIEALRGQAAFSISETEQPRMSKLLLKSREAGLTSEEEAELNAFSAECETTSLAKMQALRILTQLGELPENA
jgi:hypothetical protein